MSCLYCHQPTQGSAAFCCQACAILHHGQFQALAQRAQVARKQKWLHYDSDAVSATYDLSHAPGVRVYRFYIQGLQCSSCIHLLEKLPEFEAAIQSAVVYFGTSELMVTSRPSLPLSEIFSLIEEMGYFPHILKKDEKLDEQVLQENRRWLRQIAVAGACAGNIMMFIIPVYAGVGEPYKTIFLWLSFALFLPILFYSAQAFYPGAWRALKTKTLNIDFAMTLALVGSFVFSTFNLVRHSGLVYYDSTASFIFLILISRYQVKKAQLKTINDLKTQDSIWDKSYAVITDSGLSHKPPQDIQVGDVVLISTGQILPFDAELSSPSSLWDSSMMTGESRPQAYSRNMKIFGGLRLLSEPSQVKVLATLEQSELHKMLDVISKESLHKSAFVQKMDLFAQKLLLTVILSGFVFIAAYSFINVEEAFQRALALWVVACPCALAFAAPLALHKALLKAREAGLLLKSVDVFEKTKSLQEIVFDKTGTLTTGRLQLQKTEPVDIPENIKALILSLETKSMHPVAFAFRQAWPTVQACDDVSDVHEILGEKIYGLKDGKMYSLQASPESGLSTQIDLTENGIKIAHFELTDELHTDTKSVIDRLKNKYNLAILSGDRKERVYEVAQSLQIPLESAYFEQKPLDKLNYVESRKNVMLVGDGANDTAALKHAYLSVAAQGSMEMSLKVSDIYLLKPGLKSIEDFLKISRHTQIVLQRNFMIALTYNSVAGVCALFGYINPLAAAILMPISSLMLLVSTLGGWK